MMQNFSVQTIRDHWRSFSALAIAAAVGALAFCLPAATDPLTDLKAGAAALDAKHYAAAAATLQPLPKRLPKLADYAAWFLASAQFETKNFADAVKSAEAVWSNVPPSPLAARAVLLASRAYLQEEQPAKALELLRAKYNQLPQPAGDLAMARAFSAAGDLVSAAAYHQRVYLGYPLSSDAAAAEAEDAKLRAALGEKYPPAMPNAMLGRAFKLLESGHATQARG